MTGFWQIYDKMELPDKQGFVYFGLLIKHKLDWTRMISRREVFGLVV